MNELLKTFVIFALTAAVFIFCGGMIKHYVWTPAVSETAGAPAQQASRNTGEEPSDNLSESSQTGQDRIQAAAVSTQNTTGSTDSVSDSVSASASNKNKDLSELSLDELIDVLNRMRMEGNTMFIPTELIDDNTYAVFQSLAGQGEFQDFEVREDGYITFPVDDDLRSYLADLASTQIDEALQKVSAEPETLIRSITANDSYTEFTVYTELNDASVYPDEVDLLLTAMGKLYYNMSGGSANQFTVIYKNADTKEELAVRHFTA